ncbi:MAG: PEP-CTERM sorting domain-containing protein [Gammaproteobacteria bacterium]|nr:PEP-CTERM sorting domain-containing protein [Gammaproteobacteria bacterium]
MVKRLYLLVLALLCSTAAHAAPMLYEFSASYTGSSVPREVRGDPSENTFFDIAANQFLYELSATISGSFLYDSEVGAFEIGPGQGLSIGSGSSFTATIEGDTVTDPNLGTFMLNGSGGASDFFQILIDPPVGAPFAHEISGFNRGNDAGEEFALYNLRFNFNPGPSDFISNHLENPAMIPPAGYDGALNLAMDFLLINPDGSLNEDVQQIVFFDTVSITKVPEPATLILMTAGLAGLSWRRRALKP